MRIRDADFERDKPAMLAFIMALQHFEHAFEPNRRLDPPVSEEYLARLRRDVAEEGGLILIAENEVGRAIGWAVVHEADDDCYVLEAERRYVYISELYVDQAARGSGVGRALIQACEAWAGTRGIKVMQIGVLPGNTRAERVYREAGYAHYAYQLRKYL
jgi:GNAT superfamily N-acetyltransferase